MITILTLCILASCSTKKEAETLPVEVKEGSPVRMTYRRMWEYSAKGESEDPDYINEVLSFIRSFQIGEESQMVWEDYTDIITIFYADGSEVSYEFEENNLVENGRRLKVQGNLSGLRTLLERCLEEE